MANSEHGAVGEKEGDVTRVSRRYTRQDPACTNVAAAVGVGVVPCLAGGWHLRFQMRIGPTVDLDKCRVKHLTVRDT